MSSFVRRLAMGILGLLLAHSASAQLARRPARVDVVTPKAPAPVVAGGARVLVYELHVTNFGRGALAFREIDILDTSDVRRDGGTQSAIDSVVVPVSRDVPPVLRAPLDSGEWVAGSGPSNTSDHRRALNAIAGRASIAERFAIDWAMVGSNGNTYHGDEHRNESFWAFGQSVHSVAAGDVVAVVDSIADNTPHGPLPPTTLANIAGNHVVVRIGPSRYATYAHLQRGSVRVRVHQHVGRGEVLALLGNSGQSTGPHLHFQVTDGPSVLGSEGIPYVFDSYHFLGLAKDFEEGKHPVLPRRREIPVEDAVIELP